MSRSKLFSFLISLSFAAQLSGDNITWIAQTPNSDMEVSAYWSSNAVPGSSDNAIFDSTISGISITPVEQTTPFSVLNFQFTHNASPFIFNFNRQSLTFTGVGITGNQTNATIKAINSNQALVGTGEIGSFTSGRQFYVLNEFQAGNAFSLRTENTAVDTSVNHGGSSYVGFTGFNSIHFQSTCELGNGGLISASNSGAYSGVNTSMGNLIGIAQEQVHFGNDFKAGNAFTLNVSNQGVDSGQGVGGDYVGSVAGQARFNRKCSLGDLAELTIINKGSYSGINSSTPCTVGTVTGDQFYSGEIFSAGNDLKLVISNMGECHTTGMGNQAAVLSSSQLNFFTDCFVGNNAAFLIENSCVNGGEGTLNTVGCIGVSQGVANGNFLVGSNLSMTISNQAVNKGDGNNTVGNIFGSQLAFTGDLTVGEGSSLSIFNSGTHSGITTAANNPLGTVIEQLYVAGKFTAGDSFTLNAINSGSDSSQGYGNNLVASMSDQVQFSDSSFFGHQTKLNVSNEGRYTGYNSDSPNIVSLINSPQLAFLGELAAGNEFSLSMNNTGDSNTSGNGNQIGCINGAQFTTIAGFTLGDEASFQIVNQAKNQGLGAFNNVGNIENSQFLINGNFTQRSKLRMKALNEGTNFGGSNNSIGDINGSQLNFQQALKPQEMNL